MPAQIGFVHEYAPKLMAFEFNQLQAKNVVIFIGGLTDGLLTVPYLPALSTRLESKGWSLVQGLISSSYLGWGTGSLKRDVKEISLLVKYLRSAPGGDRNKIVLMGHSTGSQDTIEYLTKHSSDETSRVDGGILQAPVSDREAMQLSIDPTVFEDLNQECEGYIKSGKSKHILPQKFSDQFFKNPISAYRWKSLTTPGGDDDYFSSDLSDETLKSTFGTITTPLLILFSGKDEFVSPNIDKHKLVQRWQFFTDPKYWSEHSKVIPGALHNVGPGSDPCAIEDLVYAVSSFVEVI